jgi:NADPH:quinone reductase-like Zn-dependent oxidoreductase
MKAITLNRYGSPEEFQITEIEKPHPNENEVLIKVHATAVTAGDCNLRGQTYIPNGFRFIMKLMFGFEKPKLPVQGSSLAGEIEDIGKLVTRFKKGDKVFGINSTKLGAYAEYVCWPEKGTLAPMPENLSYSEAASIPYGAHTALYFLRDRAKIKPGQKILIQGASGGVGLFAVQLAKYYGAEVTGVCSASNVEFVKTLGADKVIDYTREDYTLNDEKYDIVMDIVYGKISFSRCKHSLNPKGLYIAVAGGLKEMYQAIYTSLGRGKKVIFGTPPNKAEDLIYLKELIEAGHLKIPIDRTFKLEQTADAHRYFETSKRKGCVAIII